MSRHGTRIRIVSIKPLGPFKVIGTQWWFPGQGIRTIYLPDKKTKQKMAEANFGKSFDEYLGQFKPSI